VVSRVAVVVLVVVLGVGLSVVPAAASDASVAKTLVITQKDAGSGYQASKASASDDLFPELSACVGTSVAKRKVTARAQGPDLTNKQDGSQISSSVTVVKTAAMAKADRVLVSDPKFPDCLAQIAKSHLASAGITDVSAQAVDVKKYGTFSTAIATSYSGTSNGQALQLTAVQVAIFKGRAELLDPFLTEGSQPFSQAEGQAVLDRMNQRLKKARI